MRKKITQTGGNSHSISYIAERPIKTAPEIAESFINDDMELEHILKNGNTMLDKNYVAHWGQPKGIVIPLSANYKGESMDPRHFLTKRKKAL